MIKIICIDNNHLWNRRYYNVKGGANDRSIYGYEILSQKKLQTKERFSKKNLTDKVVRIEQNRILL